MSKELVEWSELREEEGGGERLWRTIGSGEYGYRYANIMAYYIPIPQLIYFPNIPSHKSQSFTSHLKTLPTPPAPHLLKTSIKTPTALNSWHHPPTSSIAFLFTSIKSSSQLAKYSSFPIQTPPCPVGFLPRTPEDSGFRFGDLVGSLFCISSILPPSFSYKLSCVIIHASECW